jgi:phage recombination protein Bet
MIETTTTDAPEWGGPITGTGADTRVRPPALAASSELAIHAGQSYWSDEQAAVLRSMGLEHATEADLRVFWHYAQRTGLDPFTRQVYFIGRDTKVKVRETNPDTGLERTIEQRVTKFTAQVGIDGWRVIGNRAALRLGVRIGHRAPLYAGEDGEWRGVWPGSDPPVACHYTLLIDGVEIVSICYYDEYVQQVWVDGKGMQPNSMWDKMPRNQLAKCGEALCWRKAFPADYSGIVLEDAAQPAIVDGEVVASGPTPEKMAPKRASGVQRNRERAHRAAEQSTDPRRPAEQRLQWSDQTRRKWVARMFALINECGLTQDDDQRIAIAQLGGLSELPEHRDGITDEVLQAVVNMLNAITKQAEANEANREAQPDAPRLADLVDDILRTWEVCHPPGNTPDAT